MKKKIDVMLITSSLICLLPFILSFIVYDDLPATVAVQWDTAGNPSNFSSKAFAAFGLPSLLFGLNLILHLVLNNDPKKANSPAIIINLAKWAIPIISTFAVSMILFVAMGGNIDISTTSPVFIGLLFIIIGNYLPKCKQNYTVGIKLPWTLHSTENWNKTHHLAGYLWIICGAFVVISVFLSLPELIPYILTCSVFIPIAYSFLLFKKGV